MGPCFSTRSMYKPFYTHRLSWNRATEKGRENCFINAENTTEKHAGPLLINKLLCAFVKFQIPHFKCRERKIAFCSATVIM